MAERLTSTMEMAGERTAACMAMGSVAVENCVDCPAAMSCPILQLKQRSETMVTASPGGVASKGKEISYIDGGSSNTQSALPIIELPDIPRRLPYVQKAIPQKQPARKQPIQQPRSPQEVLVHQYQQPPVPVQPIEAPKPIENRVPQRKTFLELLMDGVTELVLTDSHTRK